MEIIEWNGKGHITYKGSQYAMQNPNVFQIFEEFFNRVKFDNVIELGTANGGLALFLHEQSVKHGFKFTTFDRNALQENRRSKLFLEYNFDYRIKDIYTEDSIKEISGLVTAPGRTLLLCDAGDKIGEIKTYSEVIKPGDYIMCHDYAPNKEYFEEHVKGKIWDWMEIQDCRIQEAIDKNNLKQVEFDNFIRIAWGCFTK